MIDVSPTSTIDGDGLAKIKPPTDVPGAPGSAEGPGRTSWEDLRYRWPPGAAALVCGGHWELWGP